MIAPEVAVGGGPLVKRAVKAVAEHIRDERLRVGDSLPGETWFAAELKVSRAVMREAFGAMAALRLIDVGNGRRARVAALDGAALSASLEHALSTDQVSVADIWEVRRTLEVRTAALAAQYRTAREAAEIVRLAVAMESDRDDLDAITRHDIAFHRHIASAGRNALYSQIISSFGPLMQVAVPAAWRTRDNDAQRADVLDRHRRIAEAVADRAPEAASAAMERHFDRSVGDILAGAARAKPRVQTPSASECDEGVEGDG